MALVKTELLWPLLVIYIYVYRSRFRTRVMSEVSEVLDMVFAGSDCESDQCEVVQLDGKVGGGR